MRRMPLEDVVARLVTADPRARTAVVSTVLVTDAGRGSAISIIRSLGTPGAERSSPRTRVPRAPASRSRYAAETVVYPSPGAHPDAAVDSLLRRPRSRAGRPDRSGDRRGRAAAVTARGTVRRACAQLALPEPEALARAADKRATLELARRSVFRRRARRVVRDAAGGPRRGARARLAGRAQAASSRRYEAGRRRSSPSTSPTPPTTQRPRPQMPTSTGRCPVLAAGVPRRERPRRRAAARADGPPARRLPAPAPARGADHRRRELPPRERRPERRAATPTPSRLLEALRWTGLAMVEFKVGAGRPVADGDQRAHLGLAAAGREERYGLPGDARRALPRPDAQRRTAARRPSTGSACALATSSSRSSGSARRCAGTAATRSCRPPRRREALVAAARLFLPADGYDILSADDPRPGLAELAKIATKITGKVFTRSSQTAGTL